MRTTADFVGLFSRLATAAVLFLGLAAAPAFADEFTNNEALDRLFVELKRAPDPATASRIDRQIWFYWTTPQDPVLRRRMGEVLAARTAGDPVETIALLNTLIEDYPGYAEAWNQRATMYYAIGNYEASIADCEKVLELEPRHFGALSGRATMHLLLGRRALALRDMAAALEVHPFIAGRQLFPELEQKEMMRI